MKDYYKILGVSPHASLDDIRNRYRYLAFVFHPDRFDSQFHKTEAEKDLKTINEAFTVLSTADKRTAYDRSISPPAPHPGKEYRAEPPQKPPQKPPQPQTPTDMPRQPVTKPGSFSTRMAIILGLILCGLALFTYFYGSLLNIPSALQQLNGTPTAIQSLTSVVQGLPYETATGLSAKEKTRVASWKANDPNVCISWAQVTPQHVGTTRCVYGTVLKQYSVNNVSYITFSDNGDAFHFISYAKRDYPDLEGNCASASGKIEQSGQTLFMVLEKNMLARCE